MAEVRYARILFLGAVSYCLAGCPMAMAQNEPAFVADMHVDYLDCARLHGLAPRLDDSSCQLSLATVTSGHVAMLFLSLWTPWDGRDSFDARRTGLEALGRFHKALALNPRLVSPTPDWKPTEGTVAAVATMEGLHPVQQNPSEIDFYLDLGVRVVGLVHNKPNRFAFPAQGRGSHEGLTPDGRIMVQYLMDRGVLVDVSHLSDEGVADVLELARDMRAIVVATHSACRSLTNNPRNLTDEQIAGIASTGGVIGIPFHSPFLAQGRRATMDDVARHIDHVANLVGPEHVAIGSDFDGRIFTPAGLVSYSDLASLRTRLQAHGFSARDIDDVTWSNIERIVSSFKGVCTRYPVFADQLLPMKRPDSQESVECGIDTPHRKK